MIAQNSRTCAVIALAFMVGGCTHSPSSNKVGTDVVLLQLTQRCSSAAARLRVALELSSLPRENGNQGDYSVDSAWRTTIDNGRSARKVRSCIRELEDIEVFPSGVHKEIATSLGTRVGSTNVQLNDTLALPQPPGVQLVIDWCPDLQNCNQTRHACEGSFKCYAGNGGICTDGACFRSGLPGCGKCCSWEGSDHDCAAEFKPSTP